MTDTHPTVSITMACYNVEAFLNECLTSVIAQTYRDFEFIIVDDASKDGTRAILRQYAAADPRIRLILKDTNEGLAVARNDALSIASGEFILFLDGDDIYHPELVEEAVRSAERNQAELVIWDYLVFNDEREIQLKLNELSTLRDVDPADRNALLSRPAFAWTKLVRRKILRDLSIIFPPGLTYQDVPVHWRLLTQVESVAVIPRRLAFYRQQPAATTAGRGIRRADYFAVLDLVEQYLKDSGRLEKFSDLFTRVQLQAWHGVYDVISKEHRATVMAMIRCRMSAVHKEYVDSKRPLRWRTRQFFRAIQGRKAAKAWFGFWSASRAAARAARGVLKRGAR